MKTLRMPAAPFLASQLELLHVRMLRRFSEMRLGCAHIGGTCVRSFLHFPPLLSLFSSVMMMSSRATGRFLSSIHQQE